MEKEIRCAQCGARLEASDSYCPSCYASVSEKDKKDETVFEGIEIETWKQYLGDRAVDYLEIFKKQENKRFFFSFNPYAFFLNTTWMYYRKMFVEAIVTGVMMVLLIIGLAFITTISSPLMILMFPVALVFHFCVGAFSNCAYKNHLKRVILKHQGNTKKGGTSYVAAFIGTVASSLLLDIIVVPILAHLLMQI